MPSSTYAILTAAPVILFLLFGLRYVVRNSPGNVAFIPGDHRTLVVFGPPIGGRTSVVELENLVRSSYPTADFVVPTYGNYWVSNSTPYDMADIVERSIREAHSQHNYSKIILFGYSYGGLLLRKAYVWGAGFESDRAVSRGRHPWAARVDRFISLAAPNRGWPTHRTKNSRIDQYIFGYIASILGRLTGTGRVIFDVLQGSPFVANLRIQWIDLFRSKSVDSSSLPLVVHLIGAKDEVVDRGDSIDLEAWPNDKVMIKTLDGLNHREIATHLYNDQHERTPLADDILIALTKRRVEFPAYWADAIGSLRTDEEIRQLVFVMHGIRDETAWPGDIKRAIDQKLGGQAVLVKAPLYRRFALLPFLLYWDRQGHVRWFMDEYTEAHAMYPNVESIDFVGHSNGTYILASALEKYSEIKIRNVFFAGSVVPMHYNWKDRIIKGRLIGKVWNVCAASDWVVAIFPQFFQQISDWLGNPQLELLDIGAAGFRGFRTGVRTDTVRDIKYITGSHGAAFDSRNPKRLEAIVDFVTSGEDTKIMGLQEPVKPSAGLEYASNLSWIIWIIGVSAIALGEVFMYRQGVWWFLGYSALLLGVLATV
jgi:pimeloyl-ACP methyl ester carboxylesterase